MRINLHAVSAGSGPAVVLLHGLFGAGNNLGSLSRTLRDEHTVWSLDLPNHGRSDWVCDTSLAAMANAVQQWMHSEAVERTALVGHSLGGKVAMQLALSYPELVSVLVVADIAPVLYPSHHDNVFAGLDAVAASACESRGAAASVLAEHVREDMVVQFLLTNLRRSDAGTYQWRFNLEGLKQNYEAMRAAPSATAPFNGPVLFIKGEESDYIQPAYRGDILALFPQATITQMNGCGHWLHAQRPAEFNRIVSQFLAAN
ncbi:MAG: alpha/beta fold hydrolase [Pseudomonadota bacterium]